MTLDDVMELAGREQFLAVVATLRDDSTIQSSLVNAGVLDHPVTGDQSVLAFVTYGAAKLRNLRARPQVAVTFRSGWSWATVEGTSRTDRARRPESARSTPTLPAVAARNLHCSGRSARRLGRVRQSTMVDQGRVAVFVDATRIYSN